jgi:hypothetical protein
MKVGRSLSLCIRDMIANETPISEVEFIICGTAFRDEETFRRVIDNYSRTYWRNEAAAGIRIAKRLYSEGRLLQPRLQDGPAPRDDRDRIWMEV